MTFGTAVSRHRHALLSCVHAYILNTSRLFGLSLAILRNWLSYSIQGLEMNRIFMYYIPPPPGPAPGFISFLLHSFCSCCTVDNVLSIYLYILGFLIKYPLFKVELYYVACKYCCCCCRHRRGRRQRSLVFWDFEPMEHLQSVQVLS